MRKAINQDRVRTWEAAGGACCFIAGIIAALLGTALSASAWIVGGEVHAWIQAAGTALLIVAIPLILFAGFCLDWAERKEESARESKQTQRGAAALVQVAIIAPLLGITLLAPAALHGQQTIFNVPSADVLDKGKVYVELDASLKSTDGARVPKFSAFVPRIVVGVGSRVEVGLNITGNIQPGSDATTLVTAIKYKAYDGGDNGWATRVTFGGYHFSDNVVAVNAQRAGGQFGFEHPISSTFGLAADWYTGQHSAGYFTRCVIFKPQPRVTGYAGYSLGNSNLSTGNHFFLLELGYNFN